jgi:HD superfamily phosphohydrolase
VSLPKKTTVLRDPVHGDVRLTAEEMALLDTPQMQRLRGIKQLGAAHLAFPGAVHTRFDHSIGTLHMTGRLIEAIGRNFELDPKSCLGIAPEEARVIRMAALIHDVTHVPYGHNVEDQSGLMERHDAPARYRAMLSPETALGRVLRDLGAYEDVLGVLLAESGDAEVAEVPPYWAQLMSDTICSDILDYLARDAYFTGLKLGVDDRLLEHFRVDRRTGNLYIDLSKRNLLREDILSEIVRTLEARYYFSERVYYHHAKVSAGALVARAVELSLRAGTVTPEDLYQQTDASLLDLLERRSAGAPDGLHKRIGDLCRRLAERRLYKRVAVYPRYANEDVQPSLVERFFSREAADQRREVEERLSDLARFATGRDIDVMVYCPSAKMQLKAAQTHVLWPGEGAPQPLAHFAGRVPRLQDLERSYRDLWKFYVLVDATEPALLAKLQEIVTGEFPEATNTYQVPAAR